tara:strand:+ start:43247 stop:44716 length:1470 start_codon:yes stop_codon:yes gene_type:complete
MPNPAILVIDQGTSASKAFLFNNHLEIIFKEKISHSIVSPKPGWMEMDTEEILNSVKNLIHRAEEYCAENSFHLVGMGMAFQRSTFLFWDKLVAKPLTPAISWQDTRATELVKEFESEGEFIQQKSGIPLSAHFGGPKYLFSIRNNDDLKSKVKNGDVFFGPLSSYITHALTGNAVIDESIAGRSLLLNLNSMSWDDQLLDMFEVNPDVLPELVSTCTNFGSVSDSQSNLPILCVMGDQQASLVGLHRENKGDVGLNLGMSGSVLVNSGLEPVIIPSLLSNVLYSTNEERIFLLEGTINGVSSLMQWLKTNLNLDEPEKHWDEWCHDETEGILVPGHNGIAAPYWTGSFETAFLYFSHNAGLNAKFRAAMESVGFLIHDICEIIEENTDIKIEDILASGGSARPALLQFIADILGTPVTGVLLKDATAVGVAKLVAAQYDWGFSAAGLYENEMRYQPEMVHKWRNVKSTPRGKLEKWKNALKELNIEPK